MSKAEKDIEVPASTADAVKGGVLPREPGGSANRGLAGPTKKHSKRVKKTIPGPSGGMAHE
jgi:hypothetical protein